MKIIGAGFGRTGTMSLKLALEELGYPCYHMEEAVMNYEKGHLDAWSDKLEGKRNIDWHWLFADYEATLDFPSCVFYKELMDIYPDAKVILTVRDPEAWWRSFSKMSQLSSRMRYVRFIPQFGAFWDVVKKIFRRVFYGRIERNICISRFKQHIEEVKATVPPDRLLVYSVKEGWGPLCDFLGHPVPDKPFPHANSGTKEAKQKTWQTAWSTIRRKALSASPLAARSVKRPSHNSK